jgi:hypothetical protein
MLPVQAKRSEGESGQDGTPAFGPSSVQSWFRQQGPGSTTLLGRGNRGI